MVLIIITNFVFITSLGFVSSNAPLVFGNEVWPVLETHAVMSPCLRGLLEYVKHLGQYYKGENKRVYAIHVIASHLCFL